MILRGTDTVAILLEWIMPTMVVHPEVQRKAQHEIDLAVGTTGRCVRDQDLAHLSYVRAIVKETLRMLSSFLFVFLKHTCKSFVPLIKC